MFGISGVELILILVFAFLILGPEKLPDIARTAGEVLARFRVARKDMDETLKETGLVDSKTGKVITNPVDMVDRVAKVTAGGQGEKVAQKVTDAAVAAAVSVLKPRDAQENENADNQDAKLSERDARASADAGSAAKTDPRSGTAAGSMGVSFAERKARYDRERAARKANAAQQADITQYASNQKAEAPEAEVSANGNAQNGTAPTAGPVQDVQAAAGVADAAGGGDA